MSESMNEVNFFALLIAFLCVQSEVSSEGEAPLDGLSVGGGSLPVKVVEGPGIQSLDAVPKIPLMDALQEAMQEITIGSILPPSASTLALSSLVEPNGKNHAGITQRSAIEVCCMLKYYNKLSSFISSIYLKYLYLDQDRPSDRRH